MKKYTVLAHNPVTKSTLVITTIEAKSRIAAQQEAVTKYFQDVNTPFEQMVVASKEQYERSWRELVEATDRIYDEEDY